MNGFRMKSSLLPSPRCLASLGFYDITDKDLPFGERQPINGVKEPKTRKYKKAMADPANEVGAMLVHALTGIKCPQGYFQNAMHGKPKSETKIGQYASKKRVQSKDGKSDKSNVRKVVVRAGRRKHKIENKCREKLEQETNNKLREVAVEQDITRKNGNIMKGEKGVDTSDLQFWMHMDTETSKGAKVEEAEEEIEEDGWSEYSGVSDEVDVRATPSQELKGEGLSFREYMSRLKESMGPLYIRTKMLQELALEFPIPVPIPSEGRKTPESNQGIKHDHENQLVPTPSAVVKHARKLLLSKGYFILTIKDEFMRTPPFSPTTARAVVQHARKLAGLIHAEEQAADLRDLYTWLQHLGKLIKEESEAASFLTPNNQAAKHAKSDIIMEDRNPESSSDAKCQTAPSHNLQKVQNAIHDQLADLYEEKKVQNAIHDQLADLYEEKNVVLIYQAERLAASSSVQNNESKDDVLQKCLIRLQDMENAYELLGQRISYNLEDAEILEDGFESLRHELEAIGCAVNVMKRNIGDSDQKQDRRTVEEKQYSGENSDKLCQDRIENESAVLEEASSTDVKALLESEQEHIQSDSGHLTEVRVLREELTKVKRQLRFWRTKNWCESSKAYAQKISSFN